MHVSVSAVKVGAEAAAERDRVPHRNETYHSTDVSTLFQLVAPRGTCSGEDEDMDETLQSCTTGCNEEDTTDTFQSCYEDAFPLPISARQGSSSSTSGSMLLNRAAYTLPGVSQKRHSFSHSCHNPYVPLGSNDGNQPILAGSSPPSSAVAVVQRRGSYPFSNTSQNPLTFEFTSSSTLADLSSNNVGVSVQTRCKSSLPASMQPQPFTDKQTNCCWGDGNPMSMVSQELRHISTPTVGTLSSGDNKALYVSVKQRMRSDINSPGASPNTSSITTPGFQQSSPMMTTVPKGVRGPSSRSDLEVPSAFADYHIAAAPPNPCIFREELGNPLCDTPPLPALTLAPAPAPHVSTTVSMQKAAGLSRRRQKAASAPYAAHVPQGDRQPAHSPLMYGVHGQPCTQRQVQQYLPPPTSPPPSQYYVCGIYAPLSSPGGVPSQPSIYTRDVAPPPPQHQLQPQPILVQCPHPPPFVEGVHAAAASVIGVPTFAEGPCFTGPSTSPHAYVPTGQPVGNGYSCASTPIIPTSVRSRSAQDGHADLHQAAQRCSAKGGAVSLNSSPTVPALRETPFMARGPAGVGARRKAADLKLKTGSHTSNGVSTATESFAAAHPSTSLHSTVPVQVRATPTDVPVASPTTQKTVDTNEDERFHIDRTRRIRLFVVVKCKAEGQRYACPMSPEEVPVGSYLLVEGDRGAGLGKVLAHVFIDQMARDCAIIERKREVALQKLRERKAGLLKKSDTDSANEVPDLSDLPERTGEEAYQYVMSLKTWPWVVGPATPEDVESLERKSEEERHALEMAKPIVRQFIENRYLQRVARNEAALSAVAAAAGTPHTTSLKTVSTEEAHEGAEETPSDEEKHPSPLTPLSAEEAKMLELSREVTLVDCEYQFTREKITFYVTRPQRSVFADFRSMQRKLFRTFRCRIWIAYMDEVAADKDAPDSFVFVPPPSTVIGAAPASQEEAPVSETP